MSTDLFKHILANEFEDTAEDVQYLVDNDYITFHGAVQGNGTVYCKNKDFGWPIIYYDDSILISSHYMRKRNVD